MSKNYITYYQLLDIETSATTEEVIKAYKKKAIEYHPDKNEGHKTANTLFQYINQAKEVLSNPQKRLEYDYISGVKKNPKQQPRTKNIYIKENNKSTDWNELLGIGLLGLLVGVAISSD